MTTTTSERYTFPLGALNGGSVERREMVPGRTVVSGDKFGYVLFLKSRSKAISKASTDLGSSPNTYINSAETTDYLALRFSEEMLAKRVLEAFNHAADLCRKKEPF